MDFKYSNGLSLSLAHKNAHSCFNIHIFWFTHGLIYKCKHIRLLFFTGQRLDRLQTRDKRFLLHCLGKTKIKSLNGSNNPTSHRILWSLQTPYGYQRHVLKWLGLDEVWFGKYLMKKAWNDVNWQSKSWSWNDVNRQGNGSNGADWFQLAAKWQYLPRHKTSNLPNIRSKLLSHAPWHNELHDWMSLNRPNCHSNVIKVWLLQQLSFIYIYNNQTFFHR